MIAEDIMKYDHVKIVPQVYMFRELAAATQNFHPDLLLGEGGFGRVYKGQIKRTNEVTIFFSSSSICAPVFLVLTLLLAVSFRLLQ